MTARPSGGAGAGPGDMIPVCPRHPGRESYVRCQRCERPVCPECQRPAAVGVQCVDCVRSQARTVRTPRTVFGGRAGVSRPVVTLSIIVLCAVVFLLQWSGGGTITSRLAFQSATALDEPYRFVTAALLHSTSFLPHIFLNMYALWQLGPYLESLFGPVRFAALYLLSAVGGSVGYFVIVPADPDRPGWFTSVVGASGAVFGLLAAYLVVARRLRRDSTDVIGVILVNGVIGFIPQFGIAWQAHLGGLVAGAAATLVLTAPRSVRRGLLQAAGLLGVLALLVALTLIKAAFVPDRLLA